MTRPLSQVLVRRFWGGLALIVISAALLVQLGRFLLPYVSDQRDFIESELGQQLGLDVSIGGIDAQWQGLKPQLTISLMTWRNQDQQVVLQAESVYTQIDLLQTLFNRRLSWSDLSVHNLDIHLQQHENGQLSLRGMAPSDGSGSVKIDPMRLLFTRGKIDFSEIQANIYYSNGSATTWRIPNVVTENTASFHRLRASIQVDGKPQASFVMEGEGDPDNRETFLASAYLKLERVDISEIASQFAGPQWQKFKHRELLEGLAVTSELWLSMVPGGYMELNGRVSGSGGQGPLPSDFTLALSGSVSAEGQWQMGVEDVNAHFDVGGDAPSLDVLLEGNQQSLTGLRVKQLVLQPWYLIADKNQWLPEGRLKQLFADLNPKGRLNDIEVALGPDLKKDLLLSANLEQVSVGAWHGAPAVTQVDGYVQSGVSRGFVELNSQQGFSMHYTTIYKDPQVFDSAKGQVVWTLKPNDNAIYVNSGEIELVQGQTQVKGYMHLYTPWAAKTEPSELTLFIGMRNEVAANHYKYVPFVVGKPLLSWLDQSINSGRITEAGFIMRGGLDSKQGISQSIQLAADIESASLKFLPDWPKVEQLNAQLVLDGREMFSQVSSASVAGIQLSAGQVDIVKLEDQVDNVIKISAALKAPAQKGLDFLHDSPLQKTIGNSLREWTLGGDLTGSVDLQFSLSDKQQQNAHQRVKVRLSNNNLTMTDLKLPLTQLSGEIYFDERKGLTSPGLKAQLWQQPLSVVIGNKAGATDIHFKHHSTAESLALWLGSAEVLMTEGSFDYEGHLVIPKPGQPAPIELSLNSDLQGLAINLPGQYGKTAEESARFTLQLPIAPADAEGRKPNNVFELNLNQINMLLEQGQGGVVRAAVSVGGKAELTSAEELFIGGKVAQLDVTAWSDVVSRYDGAAMRLQVLMNKTETPTQNARQKNLPLRFAFAADRLNLGQAELDNVSLSAQQLGATWKLQLDSEMLAGDLIYRPGEPVKVKLDYLHLPELDSEPGSNPESSLTEDAKASTQLLGEFDFSQVFAAQVELAELSLGEKQLGKWTFDLSPIKNGLELSNINGQLADVTVAATSDTASAASTGASLRWTEFEAGYKTEIEGLISVKDIKQLSQQWQLPNMMESESGVFDLSMSWNSNPLDIDPESLQGKLKLRFKKGRFFQSTGAAGSTILRVVSLFNFDTWVRRLRLDFSDLYKEGMVFDRVEGELNFSDQKILIREPILVDTPSSKLQLAGTIDWQQESLDTRLVATLPVGNNVTLATALLVNLPAAAGVYLVSKLFSAQFDKVASVSYSISGGWDKPEVEFERLFDSKAAKKAGESAGVPELNKQRPTAQVPDAGLLPAVGSSSSQLQVSPTGS